MSAAWFPPVPGPSARQIGFAVLLGEPIPKSKWMSMTFSKSFQERYGVPMTYWSHWQKLMTFPARGELVPRVRCHFNELLDKFNFLSFVDAVDKKAAQSGVPVPGRLEMEALWVQFLVKKFDETEVDETTKVVLLQAVKKASRRRPSRRSL
jgi:hypothetical protein